MSTKSTAHVDMSGRNSRLKFPHQQRKSVWLDPATAARHCVERERNLVDAVKAARRVLGINECEAICQKCGRRCEAVSEGCGVPDGHGHAGSLENASVEAIGSRLGTLHRSLKLVQKLNESGDYDAHAVLRQAVAFLEEIIADVGAV